MTGKAYGGPSRREGAHRGWRRIAVGGALAGLVLGSASLIIAPRRAAAAVPTSTALSIDSSSSAAGAAVTLTATVSVIAASGTITFQDVTTPANKFSVGTGTLALGTTSIMTTKLLTGVRSLVAIYGGDSTFDASTSDPVSHTVTCSGSCVSKLTLSDNAPAGGSVAFGTPVTFTATLTPNGGTGAVTFYDATPSPAVQLGTPTNLVVNYPADNTDSGLTTTAAVTIANLEAGNHCIVAAYAGDHYVAPVAASQCAPADVTATIAVPLTVTQAMSSVRLTAAPASPQPFGTKVTFTATVAPALTSGAVSFQDGSTVLGQGTLDGTTGVATFATTILSVTTVPHHMTASVPESKDVKSSVSSPPLSYTLTKITPTMKLSSRPNPSPVNGPVFLTAALTPPEVAGTVSFTDGSTSLGSPVPVTGGVATLVVPTLTAGDHTINASYTGDSNSDNAGPQSITQHVSGTLTGFYVTTLYWDLLGRAPDDGGLHYWSQAVDSGVSRSAVASGLIGSQEHIASAVGDDYATLLDRKADSGGLSFYSSFIGRGGTYEQERASLAGSGEYFDESAPDAKVSTASTTTFVQALYQDLFGLTGDDSGVRYWSDQIDTQQRRQDEVAATFATNPFAYANVVEGMYQRYLRRDADTGGLVFFLGQLFSGARDEAVLSEMLGSPEYFIYAVTHNVGA